MRNLSGLKYKMKSFTLDNPPSYSDNHLFHPHHHVSHVIIFEERNCGTVTSI
jgi:hypothetical protein